MINYHLSTINASLTIERMKMQIDLVGRKVIPYELEAWQKEDMKRQYPNLEADERSASTLIWPRSRTYERTHAHRAAREKLFRKPLSARPRMVGNFGRPLRGGSGARPILRPALLEKLRERIQALSNENLVWVTSSNELGPQVQEAWAQAEAERKSQPMVPVTVRNR